MSELDFPLPEYRNRITLIQQQMKEKGLDALILLSPENIHYVSGYDCAWTCPLGEFSGIVIPLDGEPRLIVRSLESKTVRKHWMKDSRTYADWQGPWPMLREILEECNAAGGIIGVEDNTITARQLDRLKKTVPEAETVNAAGLVPGLMAHPSKLEIEFTRKSGGIVQAGMDRAIATIREGTPYYEVITQATEAMYEAGMTEQLLFGKYILACVWGGPDGGELHETGVTRTVQKGDIVTPELWGTYKHYVSGAMGSVYVGDDPPPGVTDTYKVLSEMYLSIREAMKPGASTGEVWQAGNRVYRAAYGVDYFRMLGLQQGVGFVGRLDRGRDILKPGMTYLVQPEVTDPLFLCVCASLMVTEDGCEEITSPLLELVTI